MIALGKHSRQLLSALQGSIRIVARTLVVIPQNGQGTPVVARSGHTSRGVLRKNDSTALVARKYRLSSRIRAASGPCARREQAAAWRPLQLRRFTGATGSGRCRRGEALGLVHQPANLRDLPFA